MRWWMLPQVVGLDAPLVAAAWLAALAASHRVHLTPPYYLGLMAATWVIYLLDRMTDALSRDLEEPLSARHSFSRRYWRWLLAVLVPLLLLGGGYLALWHLPAVLGKQALMLGLLALWYLAFHGGRDDRGLQRSFVLAAMGASLWLLVALSLPVVSSIVVIALLSYAASAAWSQSPAHARRQTVAKELLAGLLFALGVVASVHVWPIDGHAMLCPETLLLWALASANMFIIHCSEWEAQAPERAVSQSRPWWLLVSGQRGMLIVIALAAGCLAFTHTNEGTRAIGAAAALSALLLLSLLQQVRRLEPQQFHFLADLALVLPLPVVWWLLKH